MRKANNEIDMTPVFDRAEQTLARSGMHPVMARAVIDFARFGEQHGRFTSPDSEAPVEEQSFLSTRQAAARLGVSEKQIYRWVMAGRLRSHAFGRQHRFTLRDLDSLIESTSTGRRSTHLARSDFETRRAG